MRRSTSYAFVLLVLTVMVASPAGSQTTAVRSGVGTSTPDQLAEPPVTVSPGDGSQLVRTAAPCPTFSWGRVEGAKHYELVVYRLGEKEEEKAEPVVRQHIPGAALSWTPSLDSCLQRGERYAWSVRSVGRQATSKWSAPSLFEVALRPSQEELEAALEVVREYLGTEPLAAAGELPMAMAAQGRDPATKRPATPVPQAATSTPVDLFNVHDAAASTVPFRVQKGAPTDSLVVQADGKVTGSFDLPNLCTVLIGRYLDQRDGTVLDCNTGLIWLKNANCFGSRTWGQAQSDAAGLADGACGLTDGSSAGDWRQPTIAEFCSLPTPSVVTCPTANAVDSLVNSNFSTPAVGNTAGNGQWKAGNAFVGVQSSFYWSATEVDAGHAWYAFLFNGSVANAPKHGDSHVWPVRGGQ